MADNIELDAGSGGATVAADDVGGVHYQVVKLDVGADGVAAPLGNANPIPVSDAGGTLTVDGTVAVTGVSTAAKQDTAQTALDAIQAAVEGTLTVGSHAVTNAGTFAAQVTGTVDLGATDNAVLDAIAASVGTLDNAVAGNEIQVDVLTMPTVTVDLGVNNDVTVTGTVDLGATDNAVLDAIAASLAALDNAVGGNELQVDVLTMPTVTVNSHAVTNAGTFAVQAATAGIAADDAAVSGNPVLNAGSSIQTDGTDPSAVSAENEVATLRTDMQRNLLVNITHPRLFRASADYAAAQTNASVQGTPGASLSLYITDVIISNGATAGNITLLDGSGGTVLLEIYPAINGGVSHSYRNPLRLTANTALCITSTTVTTHSVNVTGYIAP